MIKNLKFLSLCLISLIVFNGCSSDDSSSEDSGPGSFNADDYQYFVKGKLNGEDFLYGLRTDATSIEYSNFGGFSGSCNPDNEDFAGINFSSSIEAIDDTSLPFVGFSFVRFYLCSNPQTSHEVFNDLFPVSNYAIATNFDTVYGTTGAIGISYVTANNIPYSSSVDGVTPNSSFIITRSEPLNGLFSTQNIEGEFSGTLYNINDNSDVIELTEGSFKMSVTNYL